MVDRLIGQTKHNSPSELTWAIHLELQHRNEHIPTESDLIKGLRSTDFVLVVDPEKAAESIENTTANVEVFIEEGGTKIIMGGSTDNGKDDSESMRTARALDETIKRMQASVDVIAFPGSHRQVVPGVPTMILHLPQIYTQVFRQHPEFETPFCAHYESIAAEALTRGGPAVATNYVLFNTGKITSVQKATGVHGYDLTEPLNLDKVAYEVMPHLRRGLSILELGSSPEDNLENYHKMRHIGDLVIATTGLTPMITGGINSPERVAAVTRYNAFPLGVGTISEVLPPDEFRAIFREMKAAHYLNR